MEIRDRTVLLTGASGGIGTAVARALDDRGARLILAGRRRSELEQLANSLGGGHRVACINICSTADRRELRCLATDVGIDILINNAGTLDFGLFGDLDPEQIERQIHVNLTAPVLLTRELLPLLRVRPQAAIVMVGSTFGSIGYPGFAAYCAGKFGLRGFAEALRRELADSRIRIHYLAPRATRTRFNDDSVTAMNRALGNATDEPEAVAAALVRLLQRPRGTDRYLGWPEKLFVRINSLLPGVVDRSLSRQIGTIRAFARKQPH